MRGKLGLGTYTQKGKRITPACAGKTIYYTYKKYARKDHPRVCGENSALTLRNSRRVGSPPRVRGKHGSESKLETITGITPACAGKTSAYSSVSPECGDHPRVCGENVLSICPPHSGIGSPPRVRGKPLTSSKNTVLSRITPACAGKTHKI